MRGRVDVGAGVVTEGDRQCLRRKHGAGQATHRMFCAAKRSLECIGKALNFTLAVHQYRD